MKSALIIVDVQNDFCEGGALAVQGGARVAQKISSELTDIANYYDLIVYTQDWHNPPPDTNEGHFALDGVPDFDVSWPVHCVASEHGSEFHPDLVVVDDAYIVHKGQGRNDYSGFDGVVADDPETGLGDLLRQRSITRVDVCGLAFDYCVLQTAIDARDLGFETWVLRYLSAAVHPEKAAEVVEHLVDLDIGVV